MDYLVAHIVTFNLDSLQCNRFISEHLAKLIIEILR